MGASVWLGGWYEAARICEVAAARAPLPLLEGAHRVSLPAAGPAAQALHARIEAATWKRRMRSRCAAAVRRHTGSS
eukprot:366578-Chlamydomonas_euryale.AAC.7